MPDLDNIDMREASADLMRRWLERFGPGTENDLRWWTGWTAAQVRQAISDTDAVQVRLESGEE